MAYYLIDYENLKNVSFCNNLSEQDTIVFFYSKNANSLSFDLHIALGEVLAKKEYFLAQNGGKNALDFQLSSYAGLLLSKVPNEKIYIISKDKGYSHLLSFWKERGIDRLEIRENILDNSKGTAEMPIVQTPTHNAQESITTALKKKSGSLDLTEEQCCEIEKIVNAYKTKLAINNNLMKCFRDSDKVGKITKIIKPFLKGKT